MDGRDAPGVLVALASQEGLPAECGRTVPRLERCMQTAAAGP